MYAEVVSPSGKPFDRTERRNGATERKTDRTDGEDRPDRPTDRRIYQWNRFHPSEKAVDIHLRNAILNIEDRGGGGGG